MRNGLVHCEPRVVFVFIREIFCRVDCRAGTRQNNFVVDAMVQRVEAWKYWTQAQESFTFDWDSLLISLIYWWCCKLFSFCFKSNNFLGSLKDATTRFAIATHSWCDAILALRAMHGPKPQLGSSVDKVVLAKLSHAKHKTRHSESFT